MNDLNGEPLNNVEKVLNSVGVTIRSSSGEFKSFDDVLKTISSHWNDYNQVQQAGIATAVAGKMCA